MRRLAALALAAAALLAPRARAFLGVADTSLVTVVANPAEAANWAAELQRLSSQLAAAESTLQTVELLRAYAGDPRLALLSAPTLEDVLGAAAALASGGQSEADLLQAWQAQGSAQQMLAAASLLASAGAGSTMNVFGQTQPRDVPLYQALAGQAQMTVALRSQVAAEQSARQSVSRELSLAWASFRGQTTESGKQAILAEISQLQAEDQQMDARRRAVMDDLALSDRSARVRGEASNRATDEQLLAQSAQLAAVQASRAAAADAQRQATLQKPAFSPTASDYTGLRTWTTADTGGGP